MPRPRPRRRLPLLRQVVESAYHAAFAPVATPTGLLPVRDLASVADIRDDNLGDTLLSFLLRARGDQYAEALRRVEGIEAQIASVRAGLERAMADAGV